MRRHLLALILLALVASGCGDAGDEEREPSGPSEPATATTLAAELTGPASTAPPVVTTAAPTTAAPAVTDAPDVGLDPEEQAMAAGIAAWALEGEPILPYAQTVEIGDCIGDLMVRSIGVRRLEAAGMPAVLFDTDVLRHSPFAGLTGQELEQVAGIFYRCTGPEVTSVLTDELSSGEDGLSPATGACIVDTMVERNLLVPLMAVQLSEAGWNDPWAAMPPQLGESVVDVAVDCMTPEELDDFYASMEG